MFDPRPHVLIVDDDPSLRLQLVAALDAARFHVIVAAGAPAAATLCRRVRIDLVVCSRVDTLSSFRAQTLRGGPPIVVFADERCSRMWTMTLGVSFLRRPTTVAALRDAVTMALRDAASAALRPRTVELRERH